MKKDGLFLNGLFFLIMCLSAVNANMLSLDWDTTAYWHMDEVVPAGGTTFAYINDDHNGDELPNDLLRLGIPATYTSGVPDLVSDGISGNALSFNGINTAADGDIAFAVDAWKGQQSVYVDFWFKPSDTQANNNILVQAPDKWCFNLYNGTMLFRIYHQSGQGVNDLWWGTTTTNSSTWYHVVGSYDGTTGFMSLNINDDTPVTTTTTYKNIATGTVNIEVGNSAGTGYTFAGLIDDVYVGTAIPTSVSRANATFDAYLASPFPDDTSDLWYKSGVALASLCRWTPSTNMTAVEQLINEVCDYNDLTELFDESLGFPKVYFKMPIMWRIYLDPKLNKHLSSDTMDNIEDLMWQWVYKRSHITHPTLTDAQQRVWDIDDTQNHDAVQKSCYLLALQALRAPGSSYGPGAQLYNGSGTVEQHYQAWKKWFFEYFRQRAREGLDCEIGSPSYTKYTLASWYNIYDLTEDEDLANLVGDVLDLFWAEVAGDFSPVTGLRGGAGTRWYKTSLLNGKDSTQQIAYAYGWHNNFITPVHPESLILFSSSYQPSPVVSAIAATVKKAPHLQTSRKPGKCSAVTEYDPPTGKIYHVGGDTNFSSQIRRDTYWHRDYVIGGLSKMTSDSGRYTAIVSQNRAMGIMFAANIDDRIIFLGKGTGDPDEYGYCDTGDREITGLCGTNCLVAARDVTALHSDGTRIFVRNGLLGSNLAENSGWIFTKTGPYNADNRKFVSCKNDDNRKCNTDLLAGDTATGWADRQPVIAAGGQSGNCLTFDGINSASTGDIAIAPSAWEGQQSLSVDFWFKPGDSQSGNNLILNVSDRWCFNLYNGTMQFRIYHQSGQGVDDLWWGSTTINTSTWYHVVGSYDSSTGFMSLNINNGTAVTTTTAYKNIATGTANIEVGNKSGQAYNFKGSVDTVRISIPGQNNKIIAAWDMESLASKDVFVGIKIATGGYTTDSTSRTEGIFIDLTDMWSPVVFQVGSAASYTSFDAFKTSVIANSCTYASGKLTYTSENSQKFECWRQSTTMPELNDVAVNLNPNTTYSSPYLSMNHGKNTATITYPGFSSLVLDFSYFAAPQWDDYQTIGLWHMDNLVSSKVPDDDLENAGRNKDLTLAGGLALTTGAGGMFGEALNFDGSNDYASFTNGWASCSNVKVEGWIYPTNGSGDNVIVSARNTWSLGIANNILGWTTWNSNNYSGTISYPSSITMNQWHYIVAICDASGNRTLSCDGDIVSDNVGAGIKLQSANLEFGNKSGYSRYYNGKIDDVKIAKFSTP